MAVQYILCGVYLEARPTRSKKGCNLFAVRCTTYCLHHGSLVMSKCACCSLSRMSSMKGSKLRQSTSLTRASSQNASEKKSKTTTSQDRSFLWPISEFERHNTSRPTPSHHTGQVDLFRFLSTLSQGSPVMKHSLHIDSAHYG